MRDSLRAAFAIGVLLGVILQGVPAGAHQPAEIRSWLASWSLEVRSRGGLTPEDLEDRRAFLLRHEPTEIGIPVSVALPSAEAWRPLVSDYFRPADVDTALRIIACESGGNPNARNRHSSARGLWQFLSGWYSGEWGPPFDPFDPVASTRRAAALRYARGSWSDWYASRHCWGRR